MTNLVFFNITSEIITFIVADIMCFAFAKLTKRLVVDIVKILYIFVIQTY